MKKNDLEMELNQVNSELEHQLIDFSGSVKEALILGLVRANFKTSRGFRAFINNQR